MKNLIFLLVAFTFSCSATKTATLNIASSITLTNTTSTAVFNKVASIPWEEVKQNYPTIDTARLIINQVGSNQQLQYQLETQGTGTIQNLLVQVSIPANSSISIILNSGTKTQFESKTYGRFVPERLDDFAWENDKIGYRMYGKALEGTKGDAYGIDVWVKRTDKSVINKRYAVGKYHEDLGDGLDYYHVGKTLGAGNAAPYVDEKVIYSGNYHRYKVLDNGPLRTSFVLEYDAWDVAGEQISAIKTITLDAGNQLNKVTTTYKGFKKDSIDIAVGIIKRAGASAMAIDEPNGVFTYWEPPYKTDGQTGVGVYVPGGVDDIEHEHGPVENQYLLIKKIPSGKTFTYYQGAAWDKAGEIKNAFEWSNYLHHSKMLIENPVSVKFNSSTAK